MKPRSMLVERGFIYKDVYSKLLGMVQKSGSRRP